MKNTLQRKLGFTLIELLVVVLIIGILAAVAVPKYNKAVAKARYRSALPTLRTLMDATERYMMVGGEIPFEGNYIDQLDVSIPEDPGCTYGPRAWWAKEGESTSCTNNSIRYAVGNPCTNVACPEVSAHFGEGYVVNWMPYIICHRNSDGTWEIYCNTWPYPDICADLRKEFNGI